MDRDKYEDEEEIEGDEEESDIEEYNEKKKDKGVNVEM